MADNCCWAKCKGFHFRPGSGPIRGSEPSVECRDGTSGDTLSVLGPSPPYTIKANSNIESGNTNFMNVCIQIQLKIA